MWFVTRRFDRLSFPARLLRFHTEYVRLSTDTQSPQSILCYGVCTYVNIYSTPANDPLPQRYTILPTVFRRSRVRLDLRFCLAGRNLVGKRVLLETRPYAALAEGQRVDAPRPIHTINIVSRPHVRRLGLSVRELSERLTSSKCTEL
jgi:hypothetical protein